MSNQNISQQKLEKLLNFAFQYDEEKVWNANLAELLNQANIKKTATVENAFIRIRNLNVFAKRQRDYLNATTEEAIMAALEKQGKIVQKVNNFFSHLFQPNPNKWKFTKQDFPFTLQKNLTQLVWIFQQIYSVAEQLGKNKFTHDAKFLEEVASFIHLQITKLRKENNDLMEKDKFVKDIVNKIANNRIDKLPSAQDITSRLSHHQFNKDIQTLIARLNPASKIEEKSTEAKVQPSKGIEPLSKIGSTQDDISKLKAQISKKEQEVKEMKKCLNNYIQQNQEGKKRLSALQNQKRTLQKDNQRLNNIINSSRETEEKQSALKKYEQQKRKVKQLSENMENVNASLQSIVIQLNGKSSSKSQEVQGLITQIKVLISDLQREKDNALQYNKDLNSQKEKLDQQIQDLKNTILKASVGSHESQTDYEQSKKQVGQLKKQLQIELSAKEDNAKEIKRLKDLLVNLENQRQKLKEKELQQAKKESQIQKHSQSLQQELAKKGQIILYITAQKKDIESRNMEQLKFSNEQIEAKQRQISIAIQESTKLKASNKELNDKSAQLTECNTQLKIEASTLKKKLKDKQEEYQSLEGLFNLKNDQIESIRYQMESAKEQLKKSYEAKIQQLNSQIARKDLQMEQLKRANQALIRDIQTKEEQIREIYKAREEQSILRKISDISKVPLQMKQQVRKKIEEQFQGQILQLRQRYTTLYQQNYSKFSNKSLQELDSIALMYIEQLFSHQLLQSRIDLKFRILSHLFAFNNRTVTRTRLVFKFDPQNATNFHKYIDGKANLICIVKTTLGAYLAAYYSGVYEQSIMTEPGLLISITNNDSYELHPSENRANSRTMVYDPYFLIFGNAEFRIRSGQRNIFCNFGIMNSYFNHRNKKVQDFLCAGSERETEMESYEIYEIEYQQEGERSREMVDRQ